MGSEAVSLRYLCNLAPSAERLAGNNMFTPRTNGGVFLKFLIGKMSLR